MEIFKTIVDLAGSLAWPVTLLVLISMFRREIRRRLLDVRQVKFPGGSLILKDVEEQMANIVTSAEKSLSRRSEAAIATEAAANTDLAQRLTQRLLKDVKDTFETLQLQAAAVTDLAESSSMPQTQPAPALAAPQLHPGAPIVIRWIARNEEKYPFLSVKFLRRTIFAPDPIAQEGLQFSIQKGLLELYDEANPNDPAHPTRACRLNRDHPMVTHILEDPRP